MELFDLKKDPHEINNLADDPAYAEIKKTLLAEIDHWRKNVIDDQGIAEDFGSGVTLFPATCPTPTVGEWVNANTKNYDFFKVGLPAWYPTRTLEEWQKARDLWKPWVFRDVNSKMKRPVIPFTQKEKPKKKKKK